VVRDVRDTGLLNQVMTDFVPDAVIHFAGLKAAGESIKQPLRYRDVNVAGTLNLLCAMKSCNRKLVTARMGGIPWRC
jgi:UDP-glucose 4-epimerase